MSQQVIQNVIDGRNYLRSPEVQDKLPAGFGARAAGEVQHPFRMLAVQVGVGIDHLRLYPDAKAHA